MKTLQRLIAVVLVCALCITGAGCSSMKTIRLADPPGGPLTGVKAGDLIQIRTRDGRHLRFVVQQVDGDAIVAPGAVRFERADIVQLQRKSFSLPRTIGLIGGTFAAVYVLVLAAAVSALGDLY